MVHITFHARRSLLLGCVLTTSLDPILGAKGQRKGALGCIVPSEHPFFRNGGSFTLPIKYFPNLKK